MASKRLLLVSYTAAFKLQVRNFAENSGNRSAEREFSVSEKLVRDWRKQKTELASRPHTSRRYELIGAKPDCPELEQRLHNWIMERRMNK